MKAVHGQAFSNIYEAISESGNSRERYAVTLIKGAEIGENALISGGSIAWCSNPEGFIPSHEDEICRSLGKDLVSIDGRDIFIELLGNEKEVVICGAGHLSLPLITMCRMMDMKVTVIDDREDFVEKAKDRGANRAICKPFKEAMTEVEGSDDTFFVVVTRGHRYDKDCVGEALLKDHAYVGMIGSKRHAKFVREALLDEGISDELIDSIYTPIGLKIGAETPEEIAVAIAAELIEVKNSKRKNFGYPNEILKAILDDDREAMMLATIVTREGSAPRGAGSKMLVRADGSIIGTVGGGVAEADVIEHAKNLLAGGFEGAELMYHDLACYANEDGMVCGGAINVLLETV